MIKSHIQKIIQPPLTTQLKPSNPKQRIFKYRKLSQQSPKKSPDHLSNLSRGASIHKKQLNLYDARTIKSDQYRNSYVSVNAQANTTIIDRLSQQKNGYEHGVRFGRNVNQLQQSGRPIHGVVLSKEGRQKTHVTPVKFSYVNPPLNQQTLIEWPQNTHKISIPISPPHRQLPIPSNITSNIKTTQNSITINPHITHSSQMMMDSRCTVARPVPHSPNHVTGSHVTQQPHIIETPTVWIPNRVERSVSYAMPVIIQQPVIYEMPRHTQAVHQIYYPAPPQPNILTIQHPNQYRPQQLNNLKENRPTLVNNTSQVEPNNRKSSFQSNNDSKIDRYYDSARLKSPVKRKDTVSKVIQQLTTKQSSTPTQQLYETWNIKTQCKANKPITNSNTNLLTFHRLNSNRIQQQKQADRSITPPLLKTSNQSDQFSISTIRQSKQLLQQSYSDISLSSCPVGANEPTSLHKSNKNQSKNEYNKKKMCMQSTQNSSSIQMAAVWVLLGLGMILILFQICR